MANFQTIVLDTATPQLRAPGTGDGYSFNSGATTLGAWTTTGLGVGTSSPNAVLTTQTSGTLTLDSNDANYSGVGLYITSASLSLNAVNAAVEFGSNAGRKYAAIGMQTYADVDQNGLNFYVQPNAIGGSAALVEAMRITSSGNVGIGTTSPDNKLEVTVGDNAGINIEQSGSSQTGYLNFRDSDGALQGRISYDHSNDSLRFATSNNEKLRITSGGDVGIGTTSPWSQLTVGSGGTANPASTVTFHNSTVSEYRLKLTSSTYNSDGAWLGLGFGFSNNYLKAAIIAECKDANARTNLHFCLDANASSANAELADSKMVLTYDGNLGLGVTPSAWAGSSKTMTISNAVVGRRNNGASIFGHNFYESVADTFTYTQTGVATRIETPTAGGITFNTAPSGTAGNTITFTQAMTLTAAPNLKLGGTAERATTAGTNHIDIFNGTAPVGTLTNGISLYSSSGEAYVMDAAGNATLFSPHDAVTNEWIFKSKHTPTGKVLKIDVEKMLRFINEHFGLDAIHEFTEE